MDGVRVWRTPLPARNTAGWAYHAFRSMPRFGALARGADVMHAQDIAAVLPCMVARRAAGRIPFVTTYHTSHFLERAESPFWRPVFKRFIVAADHNLAASTEIADVARGIAPGSTVEPLTNGVETSTVPEDRAVAPPGAGRPPQDPRSAPALPQERRRVPGARHARDRAQVDAEAVLIGDGPERPRLEKLAAELGVADRVRFLGARAHDDMPGLLSSGDVAVFPSLMEATSVAALEAMACEVPVAASRVGGLPEIVDDGVGALFEPADPESLARTVVELLVGGQLSSLGAAARRRVVEQWSNDRLVERHIAIYEAVVERSGRTGGGRG
jgi:glycosyltransferase involved in cell wall biosynthesis